MRRQPEMPFNIQCYLVYNEKKHAWLTPTHTWSASILEAVSYKKFSSAQNGPWPDADYDDCYVFGSEVLFVDNFTED